MLKKDKFEIPNDMGVGTMAWGDEKAGFVSDPTQKPKEGEFNPADLQVGARASSRLFDLHLGSANNTKATNPMTRQKVKVLSNDFSRSHPSQASAACRMLVFLSSLSLWQGAYNTLVNAGITFFDTSDVYGYKSYKQGFSAEQLLGRFAEENVR